MITVKNTEKNVILRKIGLADRYHGTIYSKALMLKAKVKMKAAGFVFERNIGAGFSDEITAVYMHPEHPSIEIHVSGDYSGMSIEPGKGYIYTNM